jgi:uncharacterized protein YbaP (TraB family)
MSWTVRLRMAGLLLVSLLHTVASAQALWRAQRGERVLLLVPSVHAAAPDSVHLGPELLRVLGTAASAHFELKPGALTRKDLVIAGPDEQGMKPLSREARRLVVSCYETLGLSPEVAQRVRLWVAAVDCENAFMRGYGASPAHGFEALLKGHLQNNRSLQIEGIESLDEQYLALAAVPPVMYAEALEDAAASPDIGLGRFERLQYLLRAVLQSDVAALEKAMNDTFYADDTAKVLAEQLLEKRNQRYLAYIESYVGPSPQLFVLGAFHYPGSHGLLELLRKAGYEIQSIGTAAP